MSTHSLTFVHEGGLNSHSIVCFYRHHDGYPSGHGRELRDFLNSWKPRDIEGQEALALDVVHNFKGYGDCSLRRVPTDGGNEAYNYHVYLDSRNKLALGYYNSTGIALVNIPLADAEPDYTKIAEFVYKSRYYDAQWKWRKIGVVSEDDEGFLTGYDLNDNDKFKKYSLSSILDGRINFTDVPEE